MSKIFKSRYRRFRLKSLFRKPGIYIILFALCGAFAIAWTVVFLVQWNEGETAAKNAELLLEAGGIRPPAAASTAGPQADEAGTALPADSAPSLQFQGYSVIARLDIDALDLHLPVLQETTEKALKVSVCYYTGPAPGQDGNMVITGHDYRSGAHFGRLQKLTAGDTVLLTDAKENTYTYVVYKLEHIKPDDIEALSKTQYKRELSLLTCEKSGNGRLLVRCRLEENQR